MISLKNRDFLKIADFTQPELYFLLSLAARLKRARKSGKEQPHEELVVGTLVNALKAVAELHRKRPEMDLSALRPRIDALAQDSNKAVQAEAVQAQLALDNPRKE